MPTPVKPLIRSLVIGFVTRGQWPPKNLTIWWAVFLPSSGWTKILVTHKTTHVRRNHCVTPHKCLQQAEIYVLSMKLLRKKLLLFISFCQRSGFIQIMWRVYNCCDTLYIKILRTRFLTPKTQKTIKNYRSNTGKNWKTNIKQFSEIL